MKKIILILVVVGVTSLYSCNKNDEIKCTKNVVGFNSTITIDDETYTECLQNACSDYSLGSYTKTEYAESLEADGYSCEY